MNFPNASLMAHEVINQHPDLFTAGTETELIMMKFAHDYREKANEWHSRNKGMSPESVLDTLTGIIKEDAKVRLHVNL